MIPHAWLIVIVYLPILGIILWRWRRIRQQRLIAVALFPLSVILAYLWVGIMMPAIELRAVVIRYVFLFCAGSAYYLLYDNFRQQRGR